MVKKAAARSSVAADVSPRQTSLDKSAALSRAQPRSSFLLDTRDVYCGNNLEQLGPCRTGQFWGETKEKHAFEDRHESTRAYITVGKILNEKVGRKLA
jgi:hypothetical protein